MQFKKLETIMEQIHSLSDKERSIFFEIVAEEYCQDCLEKTPDGSKKHDCPMMDEDDEDDEDDDEDEDDNGGKGEGSKSGRG